MHRINCFPAKPLEPSQALPGQEYIEAQEPVTEARPAPEGDKALGPSEEAQAGSGGVRSPTEGVPEQAGNLEIDLESLSEEAVDDLVSSMLSYSSGGDPDADLLGLVEEEGETMSRGNDAALRQGRSSYHDVESSEDTASESGDSETSARQRHEDL